MENQTQSHEFNLNSQVKAYEAVKTRFECSLNKLDNGPLILNSKIRDATKLEASIKEELKNLRELQIDREELEMKMFLDFD
jgi:hypothetical protein